MEKFPQSSPQYHEKAVNMAETNPQTALVFAVLALANAVDGLSSDHGELVKQGERIAAELGGVAASLNGIGSELVK
jgi:hypothetical protein